MELTNRLSIYKRSESLRSQAGARSCGTCTKRTSSNAGRGLMSRPKNRPPHPIKGAPSPPSGTSRTPIFRFSAPFFKNFFAQSRRRCPPCAESPRRTLAQSKTPEFRGKTVRPRLAAAPKSPAKHPPGTPKNPPLTRLHEKKLSKVRSSLLTDLPRGCILEYMRLKEPRRPPRTGRHAQHRPPPKLSN